MVGTEGPLAPGEVANRRFRIAFRGADTAEVRRFLARVADHLAWLESREADLRERLEAAEAAPPPDIDHDMLLAALGDETSRVIRTAQEAAADLRAKADDNVARILSDAAEEAARLRIDAERLLALRTKEAETAAARIREAGEAQARRVVEEATQRAEAIVKEAQDTREGVLEDLAERRRVAHQQVDQLHAGRDRLVEAYTVVRRTLDQVTSELSRVDEEARSAAAEIARRGPRESAAGPVAQGAPPAGASPAGPSPTRHPQRTDVGPARSPEPPLEEEKATAAPEPPLEEERQDELFARIRAEREAAVAHAQEVLASTPEPEPEREQPQELGAPTADIEPARAQNALEHRDKALDPLHPALMRAVKRVLQDEQNTVLDRVRVGRVLRTLDDLVGTERDHIARYAEAARSGTLEAARAGAALVGGGRADGKDAAHALATELVGSLRRRLQRAVDDAAGADEVVLAEGVNAAYREWKSERVDRLVSDHLAGAYATGTYAGAAKDARLTWVVDGDGGCPDCDDNRLAGPTPIGEAYPTGHLHPPAHAGCRCALSPA